LLIGLFLNKKVFTKAILCCIIKEKQNKTKKTKNKNMEEGKNHVQV
jgi:hypothetical protein